MKKAGIIILVIVLILVIGVELFLFLEVKGLISENGLSGIGQLFSGERSSGDSAAGPARTESPAMTPTPEPTATPVPPTPTPEPPPTEAPPPPTPVPTIGPPPTMVPVTPTPEPTLVPAKTGSISSDTGTELDMQVDWQTEDLGGGTTRVTITGKAVSYSLDIGGTSATVTLGDQSATCRVEQIRIAENKQTVTELFTTTLDMPTGSAQTLTVDWRYNGSYGGVSLPHITAEGTVS